MLITRRSWIGLGAALVAGTAIAAPPAPAAPRIDLRKRGSRDPAPLLAALSDFAAAEMRANALPGLTLAVSGPDGLEATITLGLADLDRGLPVTPAHLFQIGSISKSVVALALYRLAAAGKLDLDARAAAILPELAWPDAPITVAMLISHIAALSDFAPVFPRSPDGRHWTNYPPGTRFAYSNPGYEILGLVIERASGMALPDALASLVLKPLGMSTAQPTILTRDRARYAVGYIPFDGAAYGPSDPLAPGPWNEEDNAAGSIAATPADMARYIAFLVRLAKGDGAPLLPPALARRYITPVTDAPDFGPGARYGAGLASVPIDGRQCIHHTGGMILFSSAMTIDPQAGGGVFASTNLAAGGYRPRAITYHGCRLLRAFAEGGPLPPPPTPEKETANTALAGCYMAKDKAFTILPARDGLAVEVDGLTAPLRPLGPGRYLTTHPALRDHEFFFVDPDKPALGLWWGGTLLGRDAELPAPRPDPALVPLAGYYTTHDPWTPSVSVVVRGDRLVAEGFGPLDRAADGSWRFAEDLPAERLWFDSLVAGRPQRLVFSGIDLRRFRESA